MDMIEKGFPSIWLKRYLDKAQRGERFTFEEAADFRDLAEARQADRDPTVIGFSLLRLVAGLVHIDAEARVETPVEAATETFGKRGIMPEWEGNVPYCAEERCALYDGKRCGALGHQPGNICEPAVKLCCVKPEVV
jgi:hypothetical protein